MLLILKREMFFCLAFVERVQASECSHQHPNWIVEQESQQDRACAAVYFADFYLSLLASSQFHYSKGPLCF